MSRALNPIEQAKREQSPEELDRFYREMLGRID
jgi:hypothetical protein